MIHHKAICKKEEIAIYKVLAQFFVKVESKAPCVHIIAAKPTAVNGKNIKIIFTVGHKITLTRLNFQTWGVCVWMQKKEQQQW